MALKAAIFDVDGTILDSMQVWGRSAYAYLEKRGLEGAPDLQERYFVMTVPEAAVDLKELYQLPDEPEQIARDLNAEVETYYRDHPVYREGALELLQKLHEQGIPMVVASSTDRYCLEMAFEKLGISHFFKAVLSCSDIGVPKSKPDIFYQALEILGTRPEETVLFEDGLYSMKTGKSIGLKIVGIYDSVSAADWPEIQAFADWSVRDWPELPEIFA